MFDEKELKYLQNQDFLKTKVEINEKMQVLFGEVQQALKKHIDTSVSFPFPPLTDLQAGKISRGERYQDLPYWVLDFPKLMMPEHIFTLRTMAWWGNEFSCTLHIQGETWEELRTTFLKKNKSILEYEDVYFCVNEDPWDYDFIPENYLLISQIKPLALTEMISERSFIKLSRRLLLTKSHQLADFACESLEIFLRMIQ
jgi:hypothetical protein